VSALLVGAALAIYFFTRDRRYLHWAWQLFRFFVVLFAAVALFYIIERLVLI
jgi:hypothetical protein